MTITIKLGHFNEAIPKRVLTNDAGIGGAYNYYELNSSTKLNTRKAHLSLMLLGIQLLVKTLDFMASDLNVKQRCQRVNVNEVLQCWERES